MKTALVATMGVTPSILASTVWELAVHPQEFLGEESSVVPDKVVVFGTATSKVELVKALFHRESGKKLTGWERLRSALKKRGVDVGGKLQFSEGNIFTFGNDAGEEIDDISNTQDCHCVADTIVKELRDLAVREDYRILASISGGRKPESAIFLSCMNLFGRERDAVIHLIPTEWPSPTRGCTPPFLFPGQGDTHELKDPKTGRSRRFKSGTIQFNKINIPFIRVRNCLPDLEGSKPLPSFGELVARSQSALDRVAPQKQPPSIRFNFDQVSISLSAPGVEPNTISLRPEAFFVLACDLLLETSKKTACDIFDFVRNREVQSGDHSLLRAIHNTRIKKKPEYWQLVEDIGKLRNRTKTAIAGRGGQFAYAAAALAGKGGFRQDRYPQKLLSEEDRTTFLKILPTEAL